MKLRIAKSAGMNVCHFIIRNSTVETKIFLFFCNMKCIMEMMAIIGCVRNIVIEIESIQIGVS